MLKMFPWTSMQCYSQKT